MQWVPATAQCPGRAVLRPPPSKARQLSRRQLWSHICKRRLEVPLLHV